MEKPLLVLTFIGVLGGTLFGAVSAGPAYIGKVTYLSSNESMRVGKVGYPSDIAPQVAPAFVRELGRPTNGSCDRLASHLHLDADVVMLATNRSGEALCLLDDVELVR